MNAFLFTNLETTSIAREAVAAGSKSIVFISTLGFKVHSGLLLGVEVMMTGGVSSSKSVRKGAGYPLRTLPEFATCELDI